jgi:hypothetical protein
MLPRVLTGRLVGPLGLPTRLLHPVQDRGALLIHVGGFSAARRPGTANPAASSAQAALPLYGRDTPRRIPRH